MVEAYRSFYTSIKVKCMQARVWSCEGVTPIERANAAEGLESLIMNQLHDRVIAIEASERDLDDFMERKMALHASWIRMEHLDVPEAMENVLNSTKDCDSWMSSVATEFQKMSVYRTPRDKLVCALNGCKILASKFWWFIKQILKCIVLFVFRLFEWWFECRWFPSITDLCADTSESTAIVF